MKQNSLARLPFLQARPEKGEQDAESTRSSVSTDAGLIALIWGASASAWGTRKPHLTALPGADHAPREVRPRFATACGSGELRVAHTQAECDFFIITLKNFRIVTVQRAIQLPAFCLSLGRRKNMPGVN